MHIFHKSIVKYTNYDKITEKWHWRGKSILIYNTENKEVVK